MLLAAVLAGVWISKGPERRPALQEPPVVAKEPAGTILGLAIGSTMAEARERLDPLQVPTEYIADEKEESGRRLYWKLKETDYEWIMAWGSASGRITGIRGVFRPERAKPFGEIGDLNSAASVAPDRVKWNLRTTDGAYFRLIAQGAEQRATTVYMFSIQLPDERGGQTGLLPEEDR